MVEEQAIVVKCENKHVWVQTQRQSSCGHCSVKNTCGTQVLSKVLGNKTAHVRCLNTLESKSADNSSHLTPGDRVIIGLEESTLLTGSLLIYFLPLVTMILLGGLSVFAAKIWWPEGIDLASVIASISGLLIGLQLAQKFSKNQGKQRYEPVIIKKLPSCQTLIP